MSLLNKIGCGCIAVAFIILILMLVADSLVKLFS